MSVGTKPRTGRDPDKVRKREHVILPYDFNVKIRKRNEDFTESY